ncbi:MAG: helix-turn-helix domain-containing protein [bacterium]|nr:helix-turn-helix domain-containing protein [bacterium]
MSDLDQNINEQRSLYGEPLGAIAHGVMEALGLTQSRLAAVLGLSAPMLSQLMSGRRVKIGNPAVLARLEELTGLAAEVRSGRVPESAVPDLLANVQAATGHLTRTGNSQTEDGAIAEALHRLLRAVASGQDLRDAATLLEEPYPKIAEVLRVYGLGTIDQARDHLRRSEGAF